ncbi:hypothetical protein ABPG74_003201 [Tetrahymena malaccensis]
MNNNNSTTPKRQHAKQQLSQLMGLSQKDMNKLFFDDKSPSKMQSSSTPKQLFSNTTKHSSQNANYFTSSNKSYNTNNFQEEKETYKPSFSSSKSPIRKPPQLSQSPIPCQNILTEQQNQQNTTPTHKKDFYFHIRKNSKTPPKKHLPPLLINEENSIEKDRNGFQGSLLPGEKNIQSYINQFESVLSPVSTNSISYSTINPNQDLANFNTNSNNNNQSLNQQIQPNTTQAQQNGLHSPYANSSNNLTKQMLSIQNQNEKFFKSPKAVLQSTPQNVKQSVQQIQQLSKSPQNSQRQPDIVNERQLIFQELKNKILSMKVNAKDTLFLTSQIKEKYEQNAKYAFDFMEEKNSFVLKYYIHLVHDEIERLVQKKKNILLSRNQAFSQFLTQFINGANKQKVSLKDEYYSLLPTAIDLKEIVSKDIALLYKNLEKENTQIVQPIQKTSPKKEIIIENQQNSQNQNVSSYTNVDIQQIPNEIKQLLVKANIQINNLQKELDTEKQRVKLYSEANGLEEDFESEFKNVKIQNQDLKKQIQELSAENANLFRKFNESDKLAKQLKDENANLGSKIEEKGQRLESLHKDLEECKISLQQMIVAQQNEKSSFTITLQENDAKYNILNEKNQLIEERIKNKEDQLHQKENEVLILKQKIEELKNLQEINQLLLDVDKKDHNLVTNLICLVNKFQNNELPRNTQITVVKYLEKLNLICKYSSLRAPSPNKNEQKKELQKSQKIKSINNQTLHLLNSYMQKLMDKIVKQQVLYEELEWFKDNIQRLVDKFLQMSKNQISFNHIDFFKQEIQIKYDRIQQKISQISPDITQLESEMQEIAADQVKFLKNDLEESTDEEQLYSSIELQKENSKLKMEIQHLNTQIQQLNLKDQLIVNSLTSSLNKKSFK